MKIFAPSGWGFGVALFALMLSGCNGNDTASQSKRYEKTQAYAEVAMAQIAGETGPKTGLEAHSGKSSVSKSSLVDVEKSRKSLLDSLKLTNHHCSIDAFSESSRREADVSASSRPLAVGWVTTPDARSVPTWFRLVLHGNGIDYVGLAGSGTQQRADVARALSRPQLVSAGFRFNVDMRAVKSGVYDIYLASAPGQAKGWVCYSQWKIKVH